MIVLAGADLERAAHAAAAGAFYNAGQLCVSIERVYVEAPAYDVFLRLVADEAASLRVGPAEDPAAEVGALTTQAQLERVERHVQDAVARGARVVAGARRIPGAGRYYAPTVLADVDHEMDVMREETFGPVLPVMRVQDAEEAIRLANDWPFGLGGAVWGERRRAEALASRLRAGMVCVNDVLINGLVAGLPFGGVGGERLGAALRQ